MSEATQLKLSTLPKLDYGKIDQAFSVEMQRAVEDCVDRPLEQKPRKVAIVFLVVPKVDKNDQHNNADEALVQVEVTSSVPKRRTQVYTMRTQHNGGLLFQPESPEDPDQASMFNDPEKD